MSRASLRVSLVFAVLAFVSVGCGKKDSPGVDRMPSENRAQEPVDRTPDEEVPSGPERPLELLEVTHRYGKAVVRPGRFYAEADRTPWSAWYLPLNSDYLFAPRDSRKAPLQKYDDYVNQAFSRRAQSAAREREDVSLHDPQAPNWAGRCHAWAIASVVEAEPIAPFVSRGVQFGVGDLKALLVKTYEKPGNMIAFGQRFTDSAGAVREDMYPDQLHRLIQVELFEKRKPFLLDTDPGIQVWNHPAYRAFTKIARDRNDPTVMHVKTYLTFAKPQVPSMDYVGTMEMDQAYAYDLIGKPLSDGSLEVEYGVWVAERDAGGVNSIEDHPDFATVFPDDFKVKHQSSNPEIRNEEVEKILAEATRLRPIP